MQPPQLTMCRRMIAVGIILLGPTSTAAFEMRRCVLFASLTKAPGGDNDIPKDFRLEAQYYPGGNMMLTYRERWETTITSDGKVSQEGYAPGPRPRKISKSLMLSKRDLLELHAKVKEANFFRLKKQYLLGEPHQHSGGLRFRATVNGQTHEVSIVYGIPEVKPPDDLKRFMMLWDEVLKKVPPPRRVQKTE